LYGPPSDKPYFKSPSVYIKLIPSNKGPFFHHNHQPALIECPNGDLLAIWFTCESEAGREMAIAASRLRYGSEEWDEASVLWNPPDRNVTGSALVVDQDEIIYHFNGLGAGSSWGNLALVMRTSEDNGVTWSKPKLIDTEHGLRNQPIACARVTKSGNIILPCDAVTGGEGGTALHISKDSGRSWYDPGSKIAGIHAPFVELNDGRLLALGRGDNIDGKMPKSISADLGKTWTYSPSEFPAISTGQRAILLRLQEGPIFFASFADKMQFIDSSGKQFDGAGLFGALSFDEGETWPVKRLITDYEAQGIKFFGGAWTGEFIMRYNQAEHKGYLTATEARNGVIHLISSAQHYAFNMKWLMTLPPAI
jgi:hypothetical protein